MPDRSGESIWEETNHLVLMLECAIVLQHRAAASVLATKLASVAHLSVGDWIPTTVARQLDAAAALNGDRVAARACYMQALEAAGKIGFRLDMALTHTQLAELLLEEGQRSSALEHLHVALAELREMKMEPALEHALRVLQRASRRDSSRRARWADSAELTSREREVARQVANGQTNREIADALVITEGTVHVHVKHILSKLGFRSRSQVATWVIQQDAAAKATT